MPRKKLILSDIYPYHITNRSNNKEFFYLDKELLWDLFQDNLLELNSKFGCRTHALVLMSNHYHLLIDTPRANLGESMKYFHREVARQSNFKANRTNHFFGGRYKWSLIQNEIYYWNAVKYIFRNPIRAGICNEVTNYPYSSISNFKKDLLDQIPGYLKAEHLPLDWIKAEFNLEHERAISKAMRRRVFTLPSQQNNQRPIYLDGPHRGKGTVT